MAETQEVQALTLRLPKADYEKLRRIVFEHDLTINGQIVRMVQEWIDDHRDCAACN